jgi:hypothetical protein
MRRLWKNDIRHWATVGPLIAIAGVAAVWYGGSPAAPAHVSGPARPAARQLLASGQGTTMLATVRSTSPRYSAPGVRASGEVPGMWYGTQSVLPVVATRPGWVEVRLAQRPNGSEAWLPASDITLGRTRYRIVINLATTHLALYDGYRKVFSAPAGIGTVSDPTPTGHYFVAFTEAPPQPNPGYGPFILVTSAHSPSIRDWDGSGDAVIGIHGPLGEDSLIGTTGARISHGCIRLHLSALLKLASVPAGTPIDIIK